MDVSLNDLPGMNADQLQAAKVALVTELRDLHYDPNGNVRELHGAEQQDYQRKLNLLERVEGHAAIRAVADKHPRSAVAGAYGPQVMTRETVWDGDGDVYRLSDSEARSKALKALESTVGTEHLSTGQRDQVAKVIELDDEYCDGSMVARRALLTESKAYRSAFAKMVSEGGISPLLTDEERASLRSWKEFARYESRGMSEGVTTGGGFGIPIFIDPTIILTGQESNNPFLRLAKSVPITTNVWKGVNSAGVSWSFDAEGSVVSDDSPTLGQPTATVFTARGFIPYSLEVGQDYPGFAEEMARILAGGYTDLEIQKLTNGNGTSEPNGIVTVLSAAASSRVRLTTGGTFSVADLYSAWEHVPVRFRSNASWLMHTVVQDKIRQFGATYGSNYVVDLGTPMIQNLLGAGVHVTDYMSQGTTNTTANVPWLIVGDFGHMVVPRRQGMSVEAIPMLFDTTTGRPTGQRGLFAWARVGATADTTTAFAMLTNVT